MPVTIGIGTVKGAWIATSVDREEWTISGPLHKGWEVTAFGRSPGGDYFLATGSNWYGPALHTSSDLESWNQIVSGPSYEGLEDRKLARIWTLATVGDRMYAGVADAGLFVSDDDGHDWQPVPALNDHASRPAWTPGLGGLALHRILADPTDERRIWVGISAVGVFITEDGGDSWELRNGGIPRAAGDQEHDVGYCVHSIVADPSDADRIWRQDHLGVFRTEDGGRQWDRIQDGVPGAGFGFPIVRDPATGALFIVPLESDEFRMPVGGRFRVYRSTDGGAAWGEAGRGLPVEPEYTGVLRGAMDVDGWSDGGVYLGTTGGVVWYSTDAGDSWRRLPGTYPRIAAVRVLDS